LLENNTKPVLIVDAVQTALEHLQAGRLIDAETACHQILEVEPCNPDALNMLGMIAYEAKMYDVSAQLLSGVIAMVPDFAQAHFNLGNALKESGMLDEAVICYQNAVALAPNHVGAYNNLGRVYQEQGKLTESVACYNKAISTDPAHADAYNNLMSVLKQLGSQRESMPFSQMNETLDSFVEYFIRNPTVPTVSLVDAFSGLFASQSGQTVDCASQKRITNKNRIDLFRAEYRVEALGRERILAKVASHVAITALGCSATCEVSRFDELSPGIVYSDSLSFDQGEVNSLRNRQAPIRQHAVVALSDARLCVSNLGFAVFDIQGTFIDGVCWGDGVLFALAPPASLPPMQTLAGTVVPLCSAWSDEYFHWILEVLPRLLLIIKAGYKLDDIDIFLVRRKLPHLVEFLNVLGIRSEKVIEWHLFPHVRAKTLLFTSCPVNYDFSSPLPSILIEPWMSREINKRFAITCRKARNRRIYIDRENARYRKVANNPEVKQLLSKYGFEFHCMETLSLQEKQALFACAEIVVGSCGAGFSNLVLCNEGAKVLVFYLENYATDSFWSICNNNNLLHFHLLCKAANKNDSTKSFQPNLNDDILVDVAALEKSVDYLIGYSREVA